MMKDIPVLRKITIVDIDIPTEDDLRFNTWIHGDAASVCFDTTDREGNDREPSFELTWEQIFQACKEYVQR